MKIRRLIDTGEWTTRRYLSLLGTILIWVIVAIDAWFLWPTQLGGNTSVVIVSGESMEPEYYSGDLLLARAIEPSVGDVIVYAPQGLGGAQIVHRIIGGNADEGWRMQGDNNDFVDPFTPKADEVKGVVLLHYANFGRLTVLLLNPMVWAFVLLIAMVLMLWYTGDDCDDADDDHDGDARSEDGDSPPEDEYEPDVIDRVVEGTEAAVARMVAATASAGKAVLAALAHRPTAPRHAAPMPRHGVRTRQGAPVAYLRGSAILAGLALVGMWASPASAASLQVNTGSGTSAMTYASCLTQPIQVSSVGAHTGNNYSQIYVGGLTAACAGLPITVDLYRNNNVLVTSVTGTAASGGTTLSSSGTYHANQVSKAVVTVDGWVKLATWSHTTTPSPFADNCVVTRQNGSTAPCTITVVSVGPVSYHQGLPYQEVNVSVGVPAGGQAVYWTADMNFGSIPGVTVTPTKVALVWGWVSAPAGCSTYPQVTLRGTDYQFAGVFVVGNPPPWRPVLCP